MSNEHFALTALSPLDGRYNSQLTVLAHLFSEFGVIKQRVKVEVEYLLFLSSKKIIPSFSADQGKQLRKIVDGFQVSDAEEVKKIEQRTKHDVKAVEYFLRQKMVEKKIPNEEYVHLALTSEDTNSLAYSLLLKDAKEKSIVPELKKLLHTLCSFAEQYCELPMLSRTHGQPAVPTTVGKEVVTFSYRLYQELREMESSTIEAKMTGAVGNFNAHVISFEKENWPELSNEFVEQFGLKPNLFTTQILPAESFTKFFSSLLRVNSILLDLNQDLWRYISDDYFTQKVGKDQVGSSTMPHKINPIDFENSEGNLGLSNSLLHFFIQKLPISRLQRDLSDSTVKRSIGSALGYCYLAYLSLQKGLTKISPNKKKLDEELNKHWEVITEGLQVILRADGDTQGYEKLKEFSQGKEVTKESIHAFIEKLEVAHTTKEKLKKITPSTYVGLSAQLTKQAVKTINHYLEGET